jgi:hypothetical protein
MGRGPGGLPGYRAGLGRLERRALNLNRHPELDSGSSGASATIRTGDSWMLNQVQHDGVADLMQNALSQHLGHPFGNKITRFPHPARVKMD